MVVLFGVSWPLSIYKSAKARTTGSKSIWFLLAIMLGYVCGIVYKLMTTPNYVTYFYILNLCMVGADAGLWFRNRAIEKRAEKLKS